ncbi:hypothetical protein A9Q94_19990 [Rhodobacterales bacterium 56_14_T64]|nr:hypothetical protein A9Q94_19990 [Rhodobacterales bacterium 56_14_T64]
MGFLLPEAQQAIPVNHAATKFYNVHAAGACPLQKFAGMALGRADWPVISENSQIIPGPLLVPF